MRRITHATPLLALTLALAVIPLAAQPFERQTSPGPQGDGYLGVTVRSLNPDLRRHFGAPPEEGLLVASVVPGSPAAAAGLAVGDVLTSLDGRGVGTSAELRRALRDRAGEQATLEVYRRGRSLRLETTLGARESLARSRWDGDGPESREEWEEWGEEWEDWGERFGERWGRWGAEMGERWGERGADWGEIGADLGSLGAELGAELGSLGAEIGLEVASALAEVDWDEIGRALDETVWELETMEWDRIADEIGRALQESAAELERGLAELDATLEESRRHPR